jgi:hypothetical protein
MNIRDSVEFSGCTVKRESDSALLIHVPDFSDKPVWLPKSQITGDSEIQEVGDVGLLVITQWIATQKGMI